MAKKQPGEDVSTEAQAPEPVASRTTMPKAPQGEFNTASQSLVSRVRSTLEQVAYSRDPNVAQTAYSNLGALKVLPPNINPPVRQYLAEALDYLQGKQVRPE
jgi:hypothetical protein